jgi:GTP-binding protein HflX
LIDAFRSTLEEAKYADAILHVVDCSNPDAERQIHIVYDTLHGLGIGDKTVITVFNKCDREEADRELKDLRADRTVYVSAKQGMGLEQLKKLLEEILREQKILIEQVFSYQEAGKIQQIRGKGQLLTEEYREDGIFVKAWLPKETYQQLRSHNR